MEVDVGSAAFRQRPLAGGMLRRKAMPARHGPHLWAQTPGWPNQHPIIRCNSTSPVSAHVALSAKGAAISGLLSTKVSTQPSGFVDF
jgi:hypothetical protein